VPLSTKGQAWIGVNNLNNNSSKKQKMFATYVKRFIRHPKTYRGGGTYGDYGGYDISLVEFKSKIPTEFGSPACLPTPSFKDEGVKTNIAGYGLYFRKRDNKLQCQTDNYGRNKYHMCAEAGDGPSVCKTSPPPSSPACLHFFNFTNHTYPEEYEEIQVVNEAENSSFCFGPSSPKAGSKGWCATSQSHYSLKNVEESGWGFCSKDCYLGPPNKLEGSNILREVKNVDVLPQNLCDIFLNDSTKGKKLQVMPKILCIGKLMPWKTQVWKKQGKYLTLVSMALLAP
jgi:hypothetical protein